MNTQEYLDDAERRGVPPIVSKAMVRLADQLASPPEPIMSQEEFEALPSYKKSMLICNYPGCPNVICTHHLLCLDHHYKMKDKY